jgi:hypothetical protein
MIETRRAAWDQLEAASLVLGEAFADYPWTRWTVDSSDHQGRVTALQRLAVERLAMPYGEVWLTSLDRLVHSVAVWMDSAVPVPAPVQRSLAPVVADLEGARHQASLAAAQELEDWRPTQPHRLLAAVGTTPMMQGQGLAIRTLRPGLASADKQGVDSFLETSSESNIVFYATLGFETVGHRRLRGGGPDVWAMLRRPQ